MKTQVGIIGGGPSGLLLSQILHLHGIDNLVRLGARLALLRARPRGWPTLLGGGGRPVVDAGETGRVPGEAVDYRLDHVRPQVAARMRDTYSGVLIGPRQSVPDRASVWERLWELLK